MAIPSPVDQTQSSTRFEELLERAFTIEPLPERLSPATLLRFSRVSRASRRAVSAYFVRAWNINRHLALYFDDPCGFRSLQSRTATLISGSNALQFLDRSFFPGSDLDIYPYPQHALEVARWISDQGYIFHPNSWQDVDFQADGRIQPEHDSDESLPAVPGQTGTYGLTAHQYDFVGLKAVYTFKREREDGLPALKIQLIVPKSSPMECILKFHSSMVMNIIAYDKAYSLYPWATFEERRGLAFAVKNKRVGPALRKYAERGWAITDTILPGEERWFPRRHRWMHDSVTWCLPLDTTGVASPPLLSPSSRPLMTDVVAFNTWKLYRPSDISRNPYHKYGRLKADCFYFSYTTALGSTEWKEELTWFIYKQTLLEKSKQYRRESPEDIAINPRLRRPTFWTWWDAEIPKLAAEWFREDERDFDPSLFARLRLDSEAPLPPYRSTIDRDRSFTRHDLRRLAPGLYSS